MVFELEIKKCFLSFKVTFQIIPKNKITIFFLLCCHIFEQLSFIENINL